MEFSKRQIEIIQAASELIGEKGIQNLTTKNLAAKMKFSEPALYRHFKGKTDILLSLLTFFTEEMKIGLKKLLVDESLGCQKIKSLIDFQFNHFSKNPAIVMVIFAETSFQYNQVLSKKVLNLLQNKKAILSQIIKKGQEDTSVRNDVDPEQMASIIMGSLRFTILRWRLTNYEFDLLKEGDKLWKTIEVLLKEHR